MTATARKKKPAPAAPVELVPPITVASFELDGDAERFTRAIRVASMFVCTDDARPVLMALHLLSDGTGTLTVEATDSYRMVRLTLPNMKSGAGGDLPAFDALAPAKWLAAQLPKRRYLTGFGLDITDSTLTVRDPLEQTTATKRLLSDTRYPDLHRFIDQPDQLDGIACEIALNPRYLASMLKACETWGPGLPVRVRSLDVMKPVRFDVVAADGNMAALQMPVRVA